jgi:hypothetical protein
LFAEGVSDLVVFDRYNFLVGGCWIFMGAGKQKGQLESRGSGAEQTNLIAVDTGSPQ